MDDLLDRMCAVALRHADGMHRATALPRVTAHVSRSPTTPLPSVYQPALCLVLQGAKQALVGERLLRYDPASYFIATIDLPVTGWVVEASREHPYVALSLRFDRDLLAGLILEVAPAAGGELSGFGVSAVTPDLLDAWSRLLSLLDTPADIPVLAAGREREVLYRLLGGPQGAALRQIARADSRLSQIQQATRWIGDHYSEPLRVDDLAHLAGMSAASFHRHFKAATALSPLQYQKALRLHEARRLLVTHGDAARAAHKVGYESASQFSREYARMFGAPPRRDAARLKGLRPQLNDAA